jgi:hypothetical protein
MRVDAQKLCTCRDTPRRVVRDGAVAVPLPGPQSATSEQVGGDHYKSLAIQPAEFIHRNGIGYLEGNVIKYIVRHKQKGRREDVEKAIHYCRLILEMDYAPKASSQDIP